MLATHEITFMTLCPSSSVPHSPTIAEETGNLHEEHTGSDDTTPGLTGANCSRLYHHRYIYLGMRTEGG